MRQIRRTGERNRAPGRFQLFLDPAGQVDSPPIVIDASLKPGLPKELRCSEEVADLVTRRRREYFPARHVKMGDSDRAHLD